MSSPEIKYPNLRRTWNAFPMRILQVLTLLLVTTSSTQSKWSSTPKTNIITADRKLTQKLNPNTNAVVYPNSTCKYSKLRVIQGANAYRRQFPWLALLEGHRVGKHDLDTIFICTGTLIRMDVVLTAANCLLGKVFEINVNVGFENWTMKDQSEDFQMRTINLQDVRVHPCYNESDHTSTRYDVGLILLPVHFEYNKGVHPIPLSEDYENNFWEYRVLGVGWGRYNLTMDLSEKYLLFSNFTVISQHDLENYSRVTNPSDTWLVRVISDDETAIMCTGDIGGPLLYHTEAGSMQIAIFSYVTQDIHRYECMDPKIPQTYVKVAVHSEWIFATMNENLNGLECENVKWKYYGKMLDDSGSTEAFEIDRLKLYGVMPTAAGVWSTFRDLNSKMIYFIAIIVKTLYFAVPRVYA